MAKPTQRELRERFRAANIYNTHNLLTSVGGGPAISYQPQGPPRSMQSTQWQVWHTNRKLDPGGHWMNNGAKVFWISNRADKPVKLEEAWAWAAENLGVTDWAKDPFGVYIPVDLYEKALALLDASEAAS